jgi:hypothetical protein
MKYLAERWRCIISTLQKRYKAFWFGECAIGRYTESGKDFAAINTLFGKNEHG